MGRFSICPKTGLKKGAWTPEEDRLLVSYISKYGHWNWRELPKFAGLSRCGKSCRLRWLNYLKPNIKRGNFTREEDEIITKLHQKFGNRWSAIAASLQGRTDNEIKNHWHTHLSKATTQNKTSKGVKPMIIKRETGKEIELEPQSSSDFTTWSSNCEDLDVRDYLGNESPISPQSVFEFDDSFWLETANVTVDDFYDTPEETLGKSLMSSSLSTSDFSSYDGSQGVVKDEIQISPESVVELDESFWSEIDQSSIQDSLSTSQEMLYTSDYFDGYDSDLFFGH
ncbi:hypothetical protein ACHQM5_003514 [Ranunculus cassubicifolius]